MMNKETIILLIFGYVFSMFSCCSESDDPPVVEEPVDTPIYVKFLWREQDDKFDKEMGYYFTLEIDSMKEGAYYIDVSIEIDDYATYDVFPEYKVAINGILSDFSFKLFKGGWQSVTLTNEERDTITVQLKEGKNSISLFEANWSMRLMKLYQNPINAGISDEDIEIWYNKTDPRIPNPVPQEPTFTENEWNQITFLSSLLPNRVKMDFEEIYITWVNSWESYWFRPPLRYPPSWPRFLTQWEEYENLLKYCEPYGKAIWPFIIEIINQREEGVMSINLLEDLTFPLYRKLYDDIEIAAHKVNVWGYQTIAKVYSKILLEVEYDNMLKAIQDLPEMKNEVF